VTAAADRWLLVVAATARSFRVRAAM